MCMLVEVRCEIGKSGSIDEHLKNEGHSQVYPVGLLPAYGSLLSSQILQNLLLLTRYIGHLRLAHLVHLWLNHLRVAHLWLTHLRLTYLRLRHTHLWLPHLHAHLRHAHALKVNRIHDRQVAYKFWAACCESEVSWSRRLV